MPVLRNPDEPSSHEPSSHEPVEPSSHEPVEPSSDERSSVSARRKRWLPAVLLVAAAAVGLPLVDDVPSDHEVELVLANPEDVRRVELTWLQGDEVIRSAKYPLGPAGERRIRAKVRVPPGEYRLLVVLERSGGRAQTEHLVRLDDEVESVSITVR